MDATELSTRVQERVKGREMARELYNLIDASTATKHYRESLCEELQRLCGVLDEPAKESMATLTPIQQLESTLMPFGAHQGQEFRDVPLDYLDWLCRSQEEFYRKLRAYLRHPELDSRRPHEGLGDS